MPVEVNSPFSGGTVARIFTATGTATEKPSVRLETAGGVLIQAATVTYDSVTGKWQASFNLPTDQSGLTLVAVLSDPNEFSRLLNITVTNGPGSGSGTGSGSGGSGSGSGSGSGGSGSGSGSGSGGSSSGSGSGGSGSGMGTNTSQSGSGSGSGSS